jgi:hypothetical protein
MKLQTILSCFAFSPGGNKTLKAPKMKSTKWLVKIKANA